MFNIYSYKMILKDQIKLDDKILLTYYILYIFLMGHCPKQTNTG